jgi:hypothetical protein
MFSAASPFFVRLYPAAKGDWGSCSLIARILTHFMAVDFMLERCRLWLSRILGGFAAGFFLFAFFCLLFLRAVFRRAGTSGAPDRSAWQPARGLLRGF